MGKVQFVLNGKESTVGGPGPRATQVIEFIRRIPDGKYFNAQGIAECLKTTKSAVQQAARYVSDDLEGHCLLVPRDSGNTGGAQMVYGSKKGIASLKKQLQDSGLI